jgi:prepilin-type N-terminal cleavage/methylation domain-containing protein
MMKKQFNQSGFTLMELLVIVAIVSVAMVSMMGLYVYVMIEAQVSGEKTMAVLNAQEKIEEVRRHNFNSIATDYAAGGTPGNVFTPSPLDGEGLINIASANADCYTVEVSVAWKSNLGRVIGEDTNLNRQKDAGEDTNGNGVLDFPVILKTMISRR